MSIPLLFGKKAIPSGVVVASSSVASRTESAYSRQIA